jgi:hypothetical protein
LFSREQPESGPVGPGGRRRAGFVDPPDGHRGRPGAQRSARARLQWLAGSPSDYATLLTNAYTELGLLVTATGE